MKFLHIIAGISALVSGAVAIYAAKGGKLHRKSGMVFVFTMIFMSASGAALAIIKPERISIVAGLLTFYLTVTALLSIRHRAQKFYWTDAAAMFIGLTAGILGFKFGFDALNSVTGTLDGLPSPPGFLFGAVATLAVIGDLRLMRRGISAKRRIARHLWRMCFALWIAAASFFLGQAQVFPEQIRIIPLLMIPPLLVLLSMLYWLVRVLLRNGVSPVR
ncbi:MAG TPA: hypothetical protein VF599_22055 [Pyrinomonadaceae bacterium]|jgi:uncharacterized membrane protein